MIKINLLPVEKRKAERTPLPRFGLILTNVAVFGVLLVVVLWSLVQARQVQDEIDVVNKDIERLRPSAEKFDTLTTEKADLDSKLGVLKTVTNERPFAWWQIFDAVWEVVQNNKVWLDSIEVELGQAAQSKMKSNDDQWKKNAIVGLKLKCHTGGLDVANLTKFRRDLKGHPILARLFPEVNFWTDWSVGDQKDFLEQFSLDFEVYLVNSGETAPMPPRPVRE